MKMRVWTQNPVDRKARVGSIPSSGMSYIPCYSTPLDCFCFLFSLGSERRYSVFFGMDLAPGLRAGSVMGYPSLT